MIAVADGVGGWSSKNVDPAIYARGIIKAIQELWEKDYKKYIKNPKLLII